MIGAWRRISCMPHARKPKVTKRHIESLCAEYLPLATRIAGRNADHAGAALFEVVRRFDPTQANFRRWFARDFPRQIVNQVRTESGRVGSPRRKILDLEAPMATDVEQPRRLTSLTDDLRACLRRIDRMPIPERWRVFGIFVGELSEPTVLNLIARMPSPAHGV